MFGLKSTQEQLADIRDASETGVAFAHIDTCLGSFLQDHHNRDGECLFGVYVDGTTTIRQVLDGLKDEVRMTGDRVPDYVTDEMISAAIESAFDGADMDRLVAPSADVPSDDEDDFSESCQAWFVLTWDVPDEEEPD